MITQLPDTEEQKYTVFRNMLNKDYENISVGFWADVKSVASKTPGQGCGVGVGVAQSRGNEPGVGVGADHSCLGSDSGTLIKICGIACPCRHENLLPFCFFFFGGGNVFPFFSITVALYIIIWDL